MHEDISFAGESQHGGALLRRVDSVEAMLPQAARMRVMRVLVHKVAGDGHGLLRAGREGEDAAQGMFVDEEVTGGERQLIFGDRAGILKAIFGVQVADNATFMAPEVLGRDKQGFLYFEADLQVCTVLKLIAR